MFIIYTTKDSAVWRTLVLCVAEREAVSMYLYKGAL